jgi:hypothetical protein
LKARRVLAHPIIKNSNEQRKVGVGNCRVEKQKLPLIFLVILDKNNEFSVEAVGNTPSEGIQGVIMCQSRQEMEARIILTHQDGSKTSPAVVHTG